MKSRWWTFKRIIYLLALLHPLFGFTDVADSLTLQLELTTDLNKRCGLLLNLSEYYMDKSEDSSKLYLDMAEQLLDEADVRDIIKWLMLKGKFHFKKGEMDKAVAALDSAKVLATENGFERDRVRALLKSSEVYMFIGQHNVQYKLARMALKEAKSNDLASEEAQALMLIGEVFRRLKEDADALHYLRAGAKKAREAVDYETLLKCYKGIGTYYLRTEDMDSAYQYLSLALNICNNRIDNKEELTILLIRIGRVYLMNEQFGIAERYFSQSVEEGLRSSNNPWTGRGYYWIATNYFKQDNFDEALHYLNRAISYLKMTDDAILTKMAYRLKSRIFELRSRLDSALYYHKLYYALDDTVEMRTNVQEVNNIKWSYVLIDKENKIRQLAERKKILEEKQQAEQRAMFWLILSIVVMAALLGLSITLARQKARLYKSESELAETELQRMKEDTANKERIANMQSEQHKVELELKNRELSTLSVQMMSKTELISRIKEEIESIYKEVKLRVKGDKNLNDIGMRLKSLLKSLASTANFDKEWEQFKLHFERVHQNFFNTLLELHPDLSQYDQKICAYLFIGLDTKQMARIMGISPESVKKQRYRMRKKMNLPNELPLAEYISDLL